EAELIEPSRSILRFVAEMMGNDLEAVVVEGHTDNRPIRTSRFPSNWELSASRAASVVRFLLDERQVLEPSRYVALGFGEYHPVDTNDTREGRAHNRRVEIFFSWEPWQSKINSELQPLKPQELLNP
ncbi:MAG: flagellar motor protein MotB, partial [Rhodothermales bacterium]